MSVYKDMHFVLLGSHSTCQINPGTKKVGRQGMKRAKGQGVLGRSMINLTAIVIIHPRLLFVVLLLVCCCYGGFFGNRWRRNEQNNGDGRQRYE